MEGDAVFYTSLLLSLLLLHLIDAKQMMGMNGAESPVPQPPPIDCVAACDERCHMTKRPNLCKRAYNSCCDTCKCVPPGTYGNYETCPCYANLTTHDGIPKCP